MEGCVTMETKMEMRCFGRLETQSVILICSDMNGARGGGFICIIYALVDVDVNTNAYSAFAITVE